MKDFTIGALTVAAIVTALFVGFTLSKCDRVFGYAVCSTK
jgi:hypothetical protein